MDCCTIYQGLNKHLKSKGVLSVIKSYHGIQIDESRTQLLTETSQYLLKQFYAKNGETPQEAYARASICFGSNVEHSQRLYDYASKRWFMYASPVLSNAVLPGQKPKSLPISCYISQVDDSVPSLLFQKAEYALLSVMGGGIGQIWSNVRSVSKKAPGSIPFMHENDAGIMAWKQSDTRKGAIASYLNVEHPDVAEFLKMRIPTGDAGRKCLNLHHGLSISDDFMRKVESGSNFDLIDPHSKEVKGTLDAREFFDDIITTRARTGEPYLYFVDTANRFVPLPQKKLGLSTTGSNICIEITLPTSKDRTIVCCLSSLNFEMYEEWKDDPQFIGDIIEMLDNVIQFFIDNIENISLNYDDELDRSLIQMLLSKVKYSAGAERSVGLGAMGWGHFLQKNMIPYESQEAVDLSRSIFTEVKRQAHIRSCELGKSRGVPSDISDYIKLCEETGEEVDEYWRYRRNLHLLAIAPNANNSVILNVSPSCEPIYSNIFTQEMRIGKFNVKNHVLEAYLESIGKNTEEVWDQIITDEGSVQKLDFLDARAKAVFKTAMEIDQHATINQAAARQEPVCQSQSTNLFFPPGSDATYVKSVHYKAWKIGMKSLYYYRTETNVKIERVSKQAAENKMAENKDTIVYGTPTCSQCKTAKMILDSKGIKYEYVDLVALGKTAAEVTGRPVRSVPQIYVDGEYVGGLNELMAFFANQPAPTQTEECTNCHG